jgi:hypothetical protein
MNPEFRSQESGARIGPAKSFDRLIVWQRAHQFVILAKDLSYGDTAQLTSQLVEVSKLIESYTAKILAPGS